MCVPLKMRRVQKIKGGSRDEENKKGEDFLEPARTAVPVSPPLPPNHRSFSPSHPPSRYFDMLDDSAEAFVLQRLKYEIQLYELVVETAEARKATWGAAYERRLEVYQSPAFQAECGARHRQMDKYNRLEGGGFKAKKALCAQTKSPALSIFADNFNTSFDPSCAPTP